MFYFYGWHNYEEKTVLQKMNNNKNNPIRKAQTSIHINLTKYSNLIIDNKTCQTYHLMRRLRGEHYTS